jgi:TolA-binding protein
MESGMRLIHIRSLFAVCTVIGCFLAGCRGSEETPKAVIPPPPSATELLQKELQTLRAKNDSLARAMDLCTKANSASNARISDLLTQVSALQEKEAAVAAAPKNEVASHPKASYLQALDLFHERRYSEAAVIFQAALDDGIQEDLRDNCTYWLGECSYAQKRYSEALKFFGNVFSFRISEKKDDAQIMTANCYLRMNNIPKAKEAIERLIKVFPASPFVRKAKEKLQHLG